MARAFDQLLAGRFPSLVAAECRHVLHDERARLDVLDDVKESVHELGSRVFQPLCSGVTKPLAGWATEHDINRQLGYLMRCQQLAYVADLKPTRIPGRFAKSLPIGGRRIGVDFICPQDAVVGALEPEVETSGTGEQRHGSEGAHVVSMREVVQRPFTHRGRANVTWIAAVGAEFEKVGKAMLRNLQVSDQQAQLIVELVEAQLGCLNGLLEQCSALGSLQEPILDLISRVVELRLLVEAAPRSDDGALGLVQTKFDSTYRLPLHVGEVRTIGCVPGSDLHAEIDEVEAVFRERRGDHPTVLVVVNMPTEGDVGPGVLRRIHLLARRARSRNHVFLLVDEEPSDESVVKE